MFDDEGSNDFPSTGMIMDAILRKQRELPWIFGNVREKEGITNIFIFNWFLCSSNRNKMKFCP